MYTRLTKVAKVDGRECVSCAFYGTSKCRIHKESNTTDCAHCDVMGAILNQLHAFEEIAASVEVSDDVGVRFVK